MLLLALGVLGGLIAGYLLGEHRADRQNASVTALSIDRAAAADRTMEVVRKESAAQIAHAFESNSRVINECRLSIAEARGVMKEAVEMARTASRSMFGTIADEAPAPSSVGESDRAAARARAAAGAKG